MADIRNTGAMNFRQLQSENMSNFSQGLPVAYLPEDTFEDIDPDEYDKKQLEYLTSKYVNRTPSSDAEEAVLRTIELENALKDSDYGNSKYDSSLYDLGVLNNLENIRGLNQSGFSQIMSGLGKMGVLTVTTFADNFLGTLVGLGNIVAEASQGNIHSGKDALNAFVNNPFSTAMQQLNDWSETMMPNYYTDEEKNNPWYTQFWKANFIGDKFLKNVGFFAGAAASGYTSSLGWSKILGLSKARDIFRGAAIAAGAPEDATAKTILQAAKSGDAILSTQQISDALLESAKTLQNKSMAVKLLSGVSGSIGESRIEAISNSKSKYDQSEQYNIQSAQQAIDAIPQQLYTEYGDELFEMTAVFDSEGKLRGYQPQVKQGKEEQVSKLYNDKLGEIQDLYNKRMEEITREKIDYSNTSFLLNLLITSVDNIAVFGDAFAGGYSMRRAYKDLVKRASTEAGEDVFYEANKALARKTLAKGIISPVAEGTQEMFQQAVTEGLNRWEGSKYNTFYGEGIDEDGVKAETTWLGNMFQALGDVYSDADQWENFFLGLVTGALPIPTTVRSVDRKTGEEKLKPTVGGELWEAVREYKAIKAQSQKSANDLNGVYKALNDAAEDKERMAFLSDKIRTRKLNDAKAAAVEEGNSFAYKNIEFDTLMSHAIAFAKAGRIDDFIELVKAYYTVRPEDLEEVRKTGIIKGSDKSIFDGQTDEQLLNYFNKQRDDAVNVAERFLDIYTNLNALYGKDIEGYTEELTHKVMSIDNREKRIKEISDKLINYVNENAASIAANNPEFAERLASGDSPLTALQSIKDLAVAFDNDDIKELQSLIQKRDISLERLANRIKLKSARRWGSAGANQKRVNTLKAKQESEGLTKEESKELARREKLIEKKKTDAASIFEELKVVNDALAKSKEVDLQQQTMALAKLLIDREGLLNDFAILSKNKDTFTEGLSNQVSKSLYADSKRRLDIAYTDFSKNKLLSKLPNQNVFVKGNDGKTYYVQISLKDMGRMAEEAGDEKLVKYIDKLDEYQTYFTNDSSDGEVFNAGESRKATALFDDINKVLKRAYGKDYGIAVSNFLNSKEAEEKYGKDYIEAFEKYRGTIASAQAATSSNATKEKVNESPLEESDRLKKLRKYSTEEDLVRNMSRDELDKLVGELGIEGEVVTEADNLSDKDIKTLSDIDDENYADYVLLAIPEAIKSELENPTPNTPEVATTVSKKEEDTQKAKTVEEEDDTPIEEPEEEEPEEDTEEVNIANRRKKIGPIRKIKARLSKKEEEESIEDDINGETKIGQAKNSLGNSERRLLPDEAIISKETFAVNRNHAKYQYSPLKDPLKRVAVPYADDVVRDVLDYYKVQEFIDSGALARLKEKAEKQGYPLRVHFVILSNINKEFNSYAKAKQPIFMAVETDDKKDSNSNPVIFYDATGKRRMQLIGMVSEPSEDTNPEEHVQYKLLQEEAYARHQASYSSKGKNAHHRRFDTGIVTNLSWIYSGRIAKAVDDGTGTLNKQPNDQIDVNDLLTTDQLDNPDGHLQIEIVTRHNNYPFGDRLGGEEIPLNDNRNASGYTGSPISRTATIWIKTKEADGRVYYKGARIKDFNSDYTYDDSPIARKIKEAIRHIVESRDNISGIHKGYDELLRYLYLSGKKPIFVNTKNDTITIKGSSVQAMPLEYTSTEEEDAIVEAVYNGIKESGIARFSLGLDGTLSLKDILDSRIVTTDLGSLHNVNASLLVDKVNVNTSREVGNREVTAIPSTTIKEWIDTRKIHTGIEGVQEDRSYTVPVSLDGGATSYRKWASDGLWHDAATNEPVEDAFLNWSLDFYLDISLGYTEPSKLYFRNKSNKVYIREYEGQEIWMDSTGHILTQEEKTELGNAMRGHSEKTSKAEEKKPKIEEVSKKEEATSEPETSISDNTSTTDNTSVIEDEFGRPRNKKKATPKKEESKGLTEAEQIGWDAIVQLKNFFSNTLPAFYGKSFMKNLTKDNVGEGIEWASAVLEDYVDKIDTDTETLKSMADDVDALMKQKQECGWRPF